MTSQPLPTPDFDALTHELNIINTIWTAAAYNEWDQLTDQAANHPAAQDLAEQCQTIECENDLALALDEATYHWSHRHWISLAFTNGIPENLANWHTHWIKTTLTQHLNRTIQPTWPGRAAELVHSAANICRNLHTTTKHDLADTITDLEKHHIHLAKLALETHPKKTND